VLATFDGRYPLYAQPLGILAIVSLGIGWLLFAYKTDMNGVIDNFSSIIMTTAFCFFFSGLFFRYGFAAGFIANLLYSLAIWSIDLPPIMGISMNISMFVIFLLLAMASYQKELISRQLFVTEKRERTALAQKNLQDIRYLDWLRKLAEFLRHEVRQPVAQINSSIELVQLRSSNDKEITNHLLSAALGAQHVWNLIERASRATDAEAFVRQSHLQWVDLHLLLADLVAAYKQNHSGLSFSLQSTQTVPIVADPMLIKEAVSNLLANATSYAEEESTVEVKLEANGTGAVIEVCNKGPLLEINSEILFGPFATTRSGPSSIHQGLGLYLVRLIAEEHGGTASLSNLEDGTGVRALISLPPPVSQYPPPSDIRALAPP
jgi:signal transduction histidine kinase